MTNHALSPQPNKNERDLACRSRTKESGATFVESAITAMVLILLTALVVDLGMLVLEADRLIRAVRIGTRLATTMNPPTSTNDYRITSVVGELLQESGLQVQSSVLAVPVDIRNSDNNVCNNVITVNARLPYTTLTGRLFGAGPITLTYQLTMRHNQQPLCF